MSTKNLYRSILIIFCIFEFGTKQQYPPYQTATLFGSDVGICPETHQCESQQRCGMAPFDSYACGCDGVCEYYDDCCYDYSSTCGLSDFTPPTADHNQIKCMTGDSEYKYGYFAIAACKNGSSVNFEIIDKCENPDINDMLSNIIVSDTNDAIYRNVFCALCNDVPTSEVTAWEVTFNCNFSNVEASTEATSDIYQVIGMSVSCPNFDSSSPPGKNDSRRHCYSGVTYRCDETYSEQQTVIDACNTGYNAVVCLDENTYRNPHCAICNFYSSYTCYVSNDAGETTGLTPLTIIMDFSAESSVSVESEYGSYIIEGVNCASGEVFDPFTNQCLQVTCKAGYTLQGSKCVAPPTSSDCGDSAIQIPDEIFCLCTLQEHSLIITYQHINDSDADDETDDPDDNGNVSLYIDQLIEYLNKLGVKYSKTEYKSTRITELEIKMINCQMAFNISNLITENLNKSSINNLTYITVQQNCFVEEILNQLHCEYDTISIAEGLDFDNTTRIISNGNSSLQVPDDEYIFKIVHQFVNESSICSSLSVSTCEVCPQIELDALAFVDQGNGTLVHESTGNVFDEHEYVFSNSSNTSSILVCSFLNQTGSTMVQTQFFNYDGALLVISVVGTILSLIGLFITILLRVIITELRTLSGKIILNVSIALFCALLLTLIQGNFIKWLRGCIAVAALLHYLWLVCFLWMNAMAFELFRTFRFFRASSRSERSQRKSFILYFIYSWGIPVVYVGIIVAISSCECTSLNVMYGDDSVCWIRDEVASFYVFGIPLAVILLPNLVLFVATITGIRESKKASESVNQGKSKQKQLTEEMVIYIRISTVMGLSWIFGFLASFMDNVALWYIFTILSSLQGFFIFIAFNLTHSVKNIMKKRKPTSKAKSKETSLSTN